MTGILLGIVVAVVGSKSSGSLRFYVLGAISFGLGVGLSFAGLPQGFALACYYGLMGLAFIVSGALVLGQYLRHNPLPPEARDE
jgi:hypothetical protein